MRIVESSSPWVPPAYTVSFTRPLVFASHPAPMSSKALCHAELTGACVASLIVTGARPSAGTTAAPASAATRAKRFRPDMIGPPARATRRSLRETRVNLVEQRACAPLGDERGQAVRDVLLRIDRKGLFEQ